jgi:hypothetical protein
MVLDLEVTVEQKGGVQLNAFCRNGTVHCMLTKNNAYHCMINKTKNP